MNFSRRPEGRLTLKALSESGRTAYSPAHGCYRVELVVVYSVGVASVNRVEEELLTENVLPERGGRREPSGEGARLQDRVDGYRLGWT